MHRLRAESLRHRQALRHRVDRDHVGRPHGSRRLDGAQPDGPEPQHGGHVAGTQAARVDGVKARANHVSGEQRRVGAHSLGHSPQHEVRSRHQRHLGLRALERAERRPVPERARLKAALVLAAAAEEAAAAGRVEAAEHPVADRDARDRVARSDDGAYVLVPDREARFDGHAAVVDVQVRAAHAARLNANDCVFGIDRLGLGALLDADHARGLEGHGSHARRSLLAQASVR